MSHDVKIALIPAYEPSDMLAELAKKLYCAGFEVLIIDDGSGENYRPIFTAAGRYGLVIAHENNRGKGCALKTGLIYIQENYPTDAVIVTLDADGQHSIEDAVRVCQTAARNGGALVLGCRCFDRNVPARSRFGNTVTRLVYRFTTGTYVSDTQTGLRAFRAELIPFLLGVAGDRYEYEMNVLLACSRQDIPIKEVNIETIYFDNNSASHFDTVKDSFRVYREIIKFAASSLTGFIVDYGMYTLLVLVTKSLGAAISIPISNILARIVSASVNYTVNKKLVFKSSKNTAKTAAQYFLLAACILAGNTLLLSLLVNSIGMNKYLAKIITEILFFATSWFVQKFFIFKKKDGSPSTKAPIIDKRGGNPS